MTLIRKICIALFGAVLLAGCDATGAGTALSFLDGGAGTRNLALNDATLADGRINVSGPEGYCVDSSSLSSSSRGGFAAIASCNILSGGAGGPIVEPVLLTVTVSPADGAAPPLETLAAALDTDLLSNRKLSSVTAGQMAGKGDTAFAGSDPRHWRGAFVLNDYLVGLALYAPKGSPLVGPQGAAFLNTVSSRIRATSNDMQRDAQQTQTTEDELASRLSRLFGGDDLQ